MPSNDPFLHAHYDALHETPMQRKLRHLAPMPIGCVFLPWPGMTEADARSHFRQMRELGFTCLKQTMPLLPEWPRERVLRLALEEDIIPFWYAEGGFEDITPELLEQLGLDPAMDVDEALEHPTMRAYQKERIGRQIDQISQQGHIPKPGTEAAKKAETREELRAKRHQVPGMVGNVKGHELHEDAVGAFIDWLKEQYGSVAEVARAWSVEHVGLQGRMLGWQSWEDLEAGFETDIPNKDYRHLRDIMRFRAETFVANFIEPTIELQRQLDPEVPVRAGGEMGIFLPFASRGTDMELMAHSMAEGGSFYPSMHLTWHFEEAHFEVLRSVYQQAALTADWAKGIWTATWESSGGPSWFSGGKAPFVKWAQEQTPGFSCHPGTMTQLMLSWLAAGYKGFGLWTWNHRTAGWEAGEFALLDRNRQLTDRARTAGAIGTAAKRWRRELWQAHKEPRVGILQDWENEAIWAAMSMTGREHYKSEPIRARMGASRAFQNGNVPFEYVTPSDLAGGLGPRYGTIYLPACISIRVELFDLLIAYVEQGGRLVMDMPGAFYDDYGRVIETAAGSRFEKLFGAVLHEYGYSRSVNNTYHLGELALEGFVAELSTTKATTIASYREHGRPAITEHHLGQGSAVILGSQASLNCCRPGNEAYEALIRAISLDGWQPLFRCDGALVYRLAASQADHYFLLNDGGPARVTLHTPGYRYGQWLDAITGTELDPSAPIDLPLESGRWLRLVKD